MFPVADDLMSLLDLEELDTDLYRGANEPSSQLRPALYGGQVAAQALRAAAHTVPEGRLPNSLHGYFLRPGRADRHVILRVARDRDGGSFSARHVVAVQNGEVIFSMSASFQTPKAGPEWSTQRTPADVPENLEDRTGIPGYQSMLQIRALPATVPHEPGQWPVPGRLWCKTWTPMPDDPVLHACVLTYASDFGSGFGDGTVEGFPRGGPSIDHSLWFHESLRLDEWVLLEMWPLKAGGSRGLYAGTMQDRDGRVGAMLTQEVLFRAPPGPLPVPTAGPTPSA
ncbi:MAG TPA: acyl-CoA thioesterase domain-containing protein [Acidimicrobiales bacterium]|jgi:acyl-CoA thioesterase-2|nr:acyl-CoA thioesterase domain-containing protein [Acidimicrobiales bacterium]